MAAIKCSVCGSTEYHPEADRRGMVDAVCDRCGAKIRKLSMTEVLKYFESRSKLIPPKVEEPAAVPAAEPVRRDKALCKWCTEDWGVRRGAFWSHIPEIKYCPMCGRELKESDRAY